MTKNDKTVTDHDYSKFDDDKWDELPVDHVCDLLREHPQLIASCPDMVWRKFRLGHWAKLIREPNRHSNYPVIASHEGRLAVVDKMQKLGVATDVVDTNHKGVMIGGFEWCCPLHWAEEYGSVFHVFRAAAATREAKIKFTAENSMINPQNGSCFGSDVLRHIQWLESLIADFAAMEAEAAKTAPRHAEEYAIIAEAANYEIQLMRHS